MARQVSSDRRAVRTRATLQHTLLGLTRSKGYEAITVRDICVAANVGRSTFYAHFSGKDDLKRSSLDHLRRDIRERQGSQPLGFGLELFEHARAYRDVYKAMGRGRGRALVLNGIRKIVSDAIRRDVFETTGELSDRGIPREIAIHFLVGAYMSALTWWLETNATMSPHQVQDWVRQLATTGVGVFSTMSAG